MIDLLVIFFVTSHGNALPEYVSPMIDCQEWASEFNRTNDGPVEAQCEKPEQCPDKLEQRDWLYKDYVYIHGKLVVYCETAA
jgi:hypothetical protein